MRLAVSKGSLALAASIAVAAAARADAQVAGGEVVSVAPPAGTASRIVATWPSTTREGATMLIAKYGEPTVSGDRMLEWYDRRPYAKIAIARDPQPHNFPAPHTDYLASTVRYTIPADRLDDLARYDGSVWFHRTRGELTAQCDKEELNNLALNLAVDVATGRRTVKDARAFYAKTAMDFKAGDRSSPYLTGLRFQTQSNSSDPDMPQK